MHRSELNPEEIQKEKTDEINKRIKAAQVKLMPGMLRGTITTMSSGTVGITTLLIVTNFAPIATTLAIGGSLLLGGALLVGLPVLLLTMPMLFKLYRSYKKETKQLNELIVDIVNYEYALKQDQESRKIITKKLDEFLLVEIKEENYKHIWQVLFYLHASNLANNDALQDKYKRLQTKYFTFILQQNNNSLQTIQEILQSKTSFTEEVALKTEKILENYDSLKKLDVITQNKNDTQNYTHLKTYSIVSKMNKAANEKLRKDDPDHYYDYQPHKPYGRNENKTTFFAAIYDKYQVKGAFEATKLIASKIYNRARTFVGGAGAVIGLGIVTLTFLSVFFTPPGWVAGIIIGSAVASGGLACYLDYLYSRDKEKQFHALQMHKSELQEAMSIGNELKIQKQMTQHKIVKKKLFEAQDENKKLHKIISNKNISQEMSVLPTKTNEQNTPINSNSKNLDEDVNIDGTQPKRLIR